MISSAKKQVIAMPLLENHPQKSDCLWQCFTPSTMHSFSKCSHCSSSSCCSTTNMGPHHKRSLAKEKVGSCDFFHFGCTHNFWKTGSQIYFLLVSISDSSVECRLSTKNVSWQPHLCDRWVLVSPCDEPEWQFPVFMGVVVQPSIPHGVVSEPVSKWWTVVLGSLCACLQQ